MTFAIILSLAVAANVGGIILIQFLTDLPWRYKGRNIKQTVRYRLDERWLHSKGRCGTALFCRDCAHCNECVTEIVNEVKAEIDAETEGGAS